MRRLTLLVFLLCPALAFGATGNTLIVWTAAAGEPTAAAFATFDTRNSHPVLDFGTTANQGVMFTGVMPRHYAAGGVTVYLHVAFSSATSNEGRFDVAWERIGDGSQDIDSDGFATANSVDVTAPGTSGFVEIAPLNFANGSEMDSTAVGESFRLRVIRAQDHANDDATGDAELLGIEIKEQ